MLAGHLHSAHSVISVSLAYLYLNSLPYHFAHTSVPRPGAPLVQSAVPVYYAKALHASITMLLGGSVRTSDNDLMRQVSDCLCVNCCAT